MEMVKTNGFYELSADEMQMTDGGVAPIVIAGLKFVGEVAAGWVICKGLDHTYNAVGRWTGWW